MPKLRFPRGDDRSRVFELVLVVLLAALVVSFNLKRQYLNEGQRAMVAGRVANLKSGRRADRVAPPIGGATIKQAAEQLNVSD